MVNSFVDNDSPYQSIDFQFNTIESPQKSPRNSKFNNKTPQNSGKKKSQQNGNKSSEFPVYPVFNFKQSNSKQSTSNNDKANSSFNSITNSKRKVTENNVNKSKNKRSSISNDLNMKPITSYYQVLPNSDSFRDYRSNVDSFDSPASDRSSSSSTKSSSTSNSSSSSSSSSLNANDSSNEEGDEEDGFEEERIRKKSKKSYK